MDSRDFQTKNENFCQPQKDFNDYYRWTTINRNPLTDKSRRTLCSVKLEVDWHWPFAEGIVFQVHQCSLFTAWRRGGVFRFLDLGYQPINLFFRPPETAVNDVDLRVCCLHPNRKRISTIIITLWYIKITELYDMVNNFDD